MTRSADLLELAADALDDGRDPFSTAFLADNGVTFDEAATLSELLALGARVVVLLSTDPAFKQMRSRVLTEVIVRQSFKETP